MLYHNTINSDSKKVSKHILSENKKDSRDIKNCYRQGQGNNEINLEKESDRESTASS